MARTPTTPTETLPPVATPEPYIEPSPVETASATLDKGLATAREQVGPLAERAKAFAKERPWTTAALVGSIAVAVFNSLRGKRS